MHRNEKWKRAVEGRKELPLRLLRAFDSSQSWSYRIGWDPGTWIWYPAPNLSVCISVTWSMPEMHHPNEHKRHKNCWGSFLGSHKSHLYHVSFQMQIDTLSCFPVMPFDVFPSKSQKRVHAHIETSFGILKEWHNQLQQGRNWTGQTGPSTQERTPRIADPFCYQART